MNPQGATNMGDLSEANRAIFIKAKVGITDVLPAFRHFANPLDVLNQIMDMARSEGPHPEQIAENANCSSPGQLLAESASYSAPDESGEWVMVPREPMPEMISAWYRVKNGHHFHDEPAPTDTSDYAAYRAMIAAAPSPLEGAGREDGSSQSQPVSALLGADCEPCAICGALPCDQTTSIGKRGPYQGYRWGYAKIDGRWCVGMLGNLDTIHDAQVIVNNHSQSDAHGEAIARTVARRLNGND